MLKIIYSLQNKIIGSFSFFLVLTFIIITFGDVSICQVPSRDTANSQPNSVFEINKTLTRTPFMRGDVFAAVNNGRVFQYRADGTLVDTLSTGIGGYTTGMVFDKSGNLYVTNFSYNSITKFDGVNTAHSILKTITDSNFATDEAIVFDSSGNYYVSNVSGGGITKFDKNDNFVAQLPLNSSGRSDFIDLTQDQHTIYYTTEGTFVGRFDLQTNTDLTNFSTALTNAFALRILADNSVLVANGPNVVRLNQSGAIIQTYDVTGVDGWFALNLDPDGTSFWSGSFYNDTFYKFDIVTGTLLMTVDTHLGSSNLYGLVVAGEITVSGTNLILTFNQIDASSFPTINAYVSVTDFNGNPITTLGTSDFTVKEDATLQSPLTVTAPGGTLGDISVALIIDRSGSMSGQPLTDAKTAAKSFVNLMRTNDMGAIISFDDVVAVNQAFSTNKTLLLNAIDALIAGNNTAIFDAIYQGVTLTYPQAGRKALILLTDGVNTAGTYNLTQATDFAIEKNIPVYTIGLNISQGSQAEKDLQQVAQLTGGKYYLVANSSDLSQIYQSLAQQLGNQYQITYTASDSQCGTTSRDVTVTVNYNSQVDRKVKGYIPTCSTGLEDENIVPVEYNLAQNYPNPFNPSTIISYTLPAESMVKLAVYNLLGQQITELVNTIKSQGSHSVQFNAANLSSGIYYYKITAVSTNSNKQFTEVKKMTLLK